VRSRVLTFMVSLVTGETYNAFLELSNAVSSVFHCSQCYSCHKTTLGSLKMAIDSLAKLTVSILFPFLLLDLLFLTVFLIVTLFRLTLILLLLENLTISKSWTKQNGLMRPFTRTITFHLFILPFISSYKLYKSI